VPEWQIHTIPLSRIASGSLRLPGLALAVAAAFSTRPHSLPFASPKKGFSSFLMGMAL
jgi:hypothetical protein